MEPLTAVILSLLIWVARARADIRCYCNDASCVITGYMCKSTVGKCFSQITFEEDSPRSVHGCVETLTLPDRTVCEAKGDIIKTRTGPAERWPILRCCKDDMCNYEIEFLDRDIHVNTKSNGSILKGLKPKQKGSGRSRDDEYRYLEETYHQRDDLWFKAAVIAVPIAGGFILILLVLLAIRMLRNDSRRHRQLMQMRRHRSLTKAQLYVADHFYDKNDRNSHFNGMDKQLTHGCKDNNLYKDVNIKVDYDGRGYEKITDNSLHGGSCNSIIVWGKTGKAEPASNV